MYSLLDTVNTPAELRALGREQLPQLASELREFLVESVSRTGGHLSSNLGTVELTIALHYVYDTPDDKLVWDVGHQTYAHKILTGRREAMSRLRMAGGISGFPKREESPYDTFGTGHSSTSISAALGMAVAAKLQGSAAACRGGHRRRRDDRRHGVRGAEQCRCDGCQSAGDPQRQRYVDLAPGRRAEQLSGQADVGRASMRRCGAAARRC